jgi:hypothetical protein
MAVDDKHERRLQPKPRKKRRQFWCAACDEVLVARYRDCCPACNRARKPTIGIVTTQEWRLHATPQNDRYPLLEYGDPDSPYERAVREVERRTGKPRTEWEHRPQSSYVQAANELAMRYANQQPRTR